MLELNPDLAGASFERACEMADALHRLCESHGDPEAIKAAFDLSYMLEYLRLNPQVQEDRETSTAAQDEVLTNKYNQAVKHAQELRAALEGYHKGADSIPYAQWSREQHAADIALKRTMR
jgi:hypothetical protein